MSDDPTDGIAVLTNIHSISTLLAFQEPFEEDDVIAICRIHEGSIPEGKAAFIHVIVENPSSGRLTQEAWLTLSHDRADYSELAMQRRPFRGFGFRLVPHECAVNALRSQPQDMAALAL